MLCTSSGGVVILAPMSLEVGLKRLFVVTVSYIVKELIYYKI